MDEGRALGVEIVEALTHIVQDVESITQRSAWILPDKVGQVTMKPLHYQTDVVPVMTIVDSHKADHIGVLQLAQNTTLVFEFFHNGVILSLRVVFDGLDQNVVELFCNTFLAIHGYLVYDAICSMT